ncbi:MAG: cupin domain-containing protein [Antricoccus sp.]
MQQITKHDAPVHCAHFPDSPAVTVLFGEDDSADIGMATVHIPAGAGMPPHRHNGSDVILTPISGAVQVTKGDEVIDVRPGDALLILKDETVALANPHEDPAELIVAAGPASFLATIRKWPQVDTALVTR